MSRDDWSDPNSDAGRARQEILKTVGELIQHNEHAARALGAMTRRGMSPIEAREEIARVLLGAQWRVANSKPGSDLDPLLDRLSAGERSTALFPENADEGGTP